MKEIDLLKQSYECPDHECIRKAKKKYPQMQDIDEDTLVLLRKGNHEAFNYIYLRFYDSLVDFATKILRSEENGREVIQNVFASIWEKRENIEPQKGIRRLLYQLVKRHAFDQIDKEKVKDKYVQYFKNHDFEECSVDQLLINKETEMVVKLTVANMPERTQEIYYLSRDKGMSHEEIANYLKISKSTVNNHLTAVLKELKEVVALFLVLFCL